MIPKELSQTPKLRSSKRDSSPVPFVPWSEVIRRLEDPSTGFVQGDHVTIIGPTGVGKTHIAIALADFREYVLFVACKPEDDLVSTLAKEGYHVTGKMEIPWIENPPGRWRPVHKKVVFWPRLSAEEVKKMPPEELLRAEKRMQRPQVGAAIGYVRKNGSWCLILDENTWVCRDLALQRDVDSALFQFRSLDASLILCGQRPAWMGQYALSMPTHLFLFQTSHKNDAKALGDISGVNTDRVIETVQNLNHETHEVLYVNTRSREMYVTIAPARGR